ncbi:Site-specific recombinase XerD [Variovorax sp. PBS-H4]|uniref:tyrosine-type recombinase/integrase n=1 Tax=Variovorax sp. PBS-H4 TaxID=434008 RepID=UPI001318351C|nr:integrase arm-type DNA-binding domain-containing protein [Variovorax sp. PBS-H4]VTU31764.1 Site-specific recombinase XerD [Variovorax sp. PBS-H4]
MYFDVRAAKLLAPGEHLTVSGCPGLRLEATASRKAWTYRYRSPVTGKLKQVKIGEYPAMPAPAAAAAWDQLRQQRAEGVDVKAVKSEKVRAARAAAATETYTVRRLVDDYVTGHLEGGRKEAGALATRRALERLLDEEEAFAEMRADQVTRATCFDILDARKATPTAAQKLRSELGSAWEYALDAGRLDGNVPNWWRTVMRGRLKSKGKVIAGRHVGQQRRALRDDEVSQLLAWLPNMHELGRDATQMYLWTCTRGAEFLGMRAEHVTEERDGWWWTAPKEATKNARFENAVDLRVPLVGRALKIVKRRLKGVGEAGWLFADEEGGQYTQHSFSTYIYDLQPYSAKRKRHGSDGAHLKALPVTGWTPHSLRRTGRTMLAALGCPEEIAEAILGHMPEGIVGTYNAYSYDKERREWLGKLSKHLEALVAQAGLPARP